MAEEVKLIGMWASPFSRRIELALKLKGVKYDYIEEDLYNKSDLLLECNPIHKKVPVLIHNGKPIVESLVILEYIDETWKHHPLLPKEPYHKATARFWANFIDGKMLPTAMKVGSTTEEKHKMLEEVHEHLKLLENELIHQAQEFFGGDGIGYQDIAAFFLGHWFQMRQEVLEIELINEEKYPVLCKWMVKLRKIDLVKECLPPKEKHIGFIKSHIEFLKSISK